MERLNRATFHFNQVVEQVILRPVAKTYRTVLPGPIRAGVRSALRNLKGPVILANDLLQGEGARAGVTLRRFLVNSTLGLGGLFDPAARLGLAFHDEDFGQTLAVWGVGEGAYLVLPVLGPSSLRDGVGLAGTIVMDPVFWVARETDAGELTLARRSLDGIDDLAQNIENLDEIKTSSLDYYAALRSFYIQNRRAEIANGDAGLPQLPDYDEEGAAP
ncbi:MAG: MlaA family lipoprotein [Pseudomonadota bacterium]